MAKVSVLVPVYNVEKYLSECLDSLVAQTLEDIEVICINDGSTDSSRSILEDYSSKHSNFRVLDQQNAGYGVAMNRGLKAATGEYIGIVESDDFASPEMFERLYSVASENKCDIVRSNRFNHANNESTLCAMLRGLSYGNVFSPVMDDQRIFVPAPAIWANLYKREFLEKNGICFLETPGASFQDTGFVYKAMIAADRVLLIEDAFLHYRVDNEQSSVKSADKVFCIVDEFQSIDKFLKSFPEKRAAFAGNYCALRYQAYQWNYNRLKDEQRRLFMKKFSKEFKKLRRRGLLDKSCFSERDWERLERVIDVPKKVLEEDFALEQNK